MWRRALKHCALHDINSSSAFISYSVLQPIRTNFIILRFVFVKYDGNIRCKILVNLWFLKKKFHKINKTNCLACRSLCMYLNQSSPMFSQQNDHHKKSLLMISPGNNSIAYVWLAFVPKSFDWDRRFDPQKNSSLKRSSQTPQVTFLNVEKL